jgi:hypothetical protein
VDYSVLVSSTAAIVAREDGVKGGDAVTVGLLKTAQEGRVQTSLSGGINTAVDTSGIALS